MALVHAGSTLLALCFFLIAELCLGALLLRKLEVSIERFAEFVLIATAIGVISTEVAIFLVQWTQHIRFGCTLLVLLSLVPIGIELPRLWPRARSAYLELLPFALGEKLLLWGVGTVLLIEYLASVAPLTGSDALHYHFTAQRLLLEQGFHPIFSLSHSFLCGQGHLLILLGLSLGSEQLAMGMIFLGGALSALSLGCLATRWVSRSPALLFVLAFLVTPLLFWQICTSGSPDIWIGVFVGAAALVLSGERQEICWRHALLAGFLTGGAAGAKYTGCVFAATLASALFVETLSSAKTALFCLAALISGIWPYLRNLIWTGDPLFPFLTKTLFPQRLNAFALAKLNADMGVAFSHHLSGAFPFLFFAGRQIGNAPAFWEFYGPIVVAFFPLIALAFRNTREWRVRMIVWITSGLLIFGTSGLVRFMLPLFAIALSCAAAGVYQASKKGWLATHRLVVISTLLFCLFGGAGLLVYSGPALLASTGMYKPKAYLEAKAPDYKIAAAIDEALAKEPHGGKVLVFFRHLYYLRSPFVQGDPDGSWNLNPQVVKTPGDFRSFFQQEGITYVARAPNYPGAIAGPLLEMERNGELLPYSETVVDNFRGNRISGEREKVRVVIFRVNPDFRETTTAPAP